MVFVDSTADGAAAILDRLSDDLENELRLARADPKNEEAIHHGRVAARRLFEAGELWASHAAAWPAERDRLPKLIRRLGRVRDADVMLEFLRKGPASDRKERAALREHVKTRRKKARASLSSWLTKARMKRLSRAMRDVAAEVRADVTSVPPTTRSLAPYFEHLEGLLATPGWSRDPERAHTVRRTIRGLRYAHETLEPAYSPEDFRRAVDAFTRVQDVAGAWQDRSVLRKLATRAARNGDVKANLSGLLGRVDEQSEALSGDFARAAVALTKLRPAIAQDTA